MRDTPVVLVSMPFGNILSPSMGLSLLKGILNREGVDSRVLYFTLRFARLTGTVFYLKVANDLNPTVRELAGEWIFARALFGDRATDERAYVDGVLRNRHGWVTPTGIRPLPRTLVRRIVRTRELVAGFLDDCVEEIARHRPRLVGFTSVFQQHVPSLALARRIREHLPGTVVVMGGANCEGVMGSETARRFPFLDAVVSGEAELVFTEVVRRALAAEPLEGLPGVKTPAVAQQEQASAPLADAPPVRDLDSLPYPDFTDYFEQFRATRYRERWQPRIFFETSRGCWWGEKQHCTFCGLNGLTMTYRSKSWQRALAEVKALARQWPESDLQAVDNILDMRYLHDFLPALARERVGVELFYETKANLRKDQLRILRAAGVRDIQPGIESFSDSILTLMRKGVTAIQNVQLLKWCQELGVRPHWNVLWGFPGEPPEDYERMAALLPFLSHFPPPTGLGGVRLDRFSPNFFDSARLGFADVRPLPAYGFVYPLPPEAVANLAYHFTFRYQESRDVDGYVAPLLAAVREWVSGHPGSALFFADTGRHLVLVDVRPAARTPVTVLAGVDRDLYLACDGISDARHLRDLAATRAYDPDEALARLDELAARGLMMKSGNRYLALAIPLGEYSPAPPLVRRVLGVVRRLGEPGPDGVRLPLAPLGRGGPLVLDSASVNGRGRIPLGHGPTRRLAAQHFSVDDRAVVVRVNGGSHAARERSR